MAPNRGRAAEDSRSESSVATSKQTSSTTNAGVSKNKRAANSNNTGSHLKDVMLAGENASHAESSSTGTNWSSVPTSTLRAYRHAYKVDTPSTFASYETELSLTNPEGLGKFSPSMARRKDKKRVNKDTVAMAVRKDFNAAAVNETDVLTSFLYSVKNQNKPFRMRFTPGKTK